MHCWLGSAHIDPRTRPLMRLRLACSHLAVRRGWLLLPAPGESPIHSRSRTEGAAVEAPSFAAFASACAVVHFYCLLMEGASSKCSLWADDFHTT